MTNIAANWPACQGIAMTSPAEIETLAGEVADLPNGKARGPRLVEIQRDHSTHVATLVKRRAQQIIEQRRVQR